MEKSEDITSEKFTEKNERLMKEAEELKENAIENKGEPKIKMIIIPEGLVKNLRDFWKETSEDDLKNEYMMSASFHKGIACSHTIMMKSSYDCTYEQYERIRKVVCEITGTPYDEEEEEKEKAD